MKFRSLLMFGFLCGLAGCNLTPAQVSANQQLVVDSSACAVSIAPATQTAAGSKGTKVAAAATVAVTSAIQSPNCQQIAIDVAAAIQAGKVTAPVAPTVIPATATLVAIPAPVPTPVPTAPVPMTPPPS